MRTFRLKYTIYRVIEIVEVRWLGTKLMQICEETILQATKAGNDDDVCFPHTVKPPNKGHFGDGPVVPCREVVLFSEVFF